MLDSRENRVASSKTTRGSQDPNSSTGYDVIVQPAHCDMQSPITPKEVKRVLEVGKLLRSVLTPAERTVLESVLSAAKKTNGAPEEQVAPVALDGHG
jgi:hypothetical protein